LGGEDGTELEGLSKGPSDLEGNTTPTGRKKGGWKIPQKTFDKSSSAKEEISPNPDCKKEKKTEGPLFQGSPRPTHKKRQSLKKKRTEKPDAKRRPGVAREGKQPKPLGKKSYTLKKTEGEVCQLGWGGEREDGRKTVGYKRKGNGSPKYPRRKIPCRER